MSVMSGGTAPKPLSSGGSLAGSAATAGMVIVFSTAQRSPSRYQVQIEADRLATLTTTPRKAKTSVGRAPLEDQQRVVAEVPPEVVGELLRPAVDLPAAADVEALADEDEDAAR